MACPGLLKSLLLVGLAAAMSGCLVSDPGAQEPVVDDTGHLVGKRVRLASVASGLDQPVYVTHAGDGSGRLFVLEQAGVIQTLVEGVVLAQPFVDLTDRVGSGGERGLLGMAFPPNFPADDRVFVSYTDKSGDTVLSSFQVDGEDAGRLDPDSESIVLQVDQPYSNHNGGMIAFGPDGFLYVGLGDGGAGGDPQGHGQNTETLLGSILRLDVSGESGYAIPADNPFADGQEGRPEIWAFGLRNPWRFSFDSETGDLWIGDVGQNTREEITRIPAGQAGANLGWNGLEGTHVFDQATHDELDEVILPAAEYNRAAPHCSVTGGYVYHGTMAPALEGRYLFADFCSGWVWAATPTATEGDYEMGLLFESNMRVSSFGVDEGGELLMLDHRGSVLRFVDNPA